MNLDRVESEDENEEADGTTNVGSPMLTAICKEPIEEQYCNQLGCYVLLYRRVFCCCALAGKDAVSCVPFVLIRQIFILHIHTYIQYSYITIFLKNISVHPLFPDRINRTLVSLG